MFSKGARTRTDGTTGFDFVSASSLASRFDGKSEQQRVSSAHPFENRKRVRHPLLRYGKQEKSRAAKAAPPVQDPPHVATDEGASEIMIVEFSVRILGPLCEENSEHHLDP